MTDKAQHLKFLIEWYDMINEARWGDDDLPPPTWQQVRDEHLTPSEHWNFGPEVSFEFWSGYMTSAIISEARELVRPIPSQITEETKNGSD